MTVQENLEIGAYVPKAKAERAAPADLVLTIFRASPSAGSSSQVLRSGAASSRCSRSAA